MNHQDDPSSAARPGPALILPDGSFVVLNGQDYVSMVWGDGSATVQVAPGRSHPGPGFQTDPTGWSRKVYRGDQVERIFHRKTQVTWRNSLWTVPKVHSDQFTIECRWSDGYTSHEELLKDPRVTRGNNYWGELWATLTLDDIDGLVISEVEFRQGRKAEETRQVLYRWSRDAE